jgi:predicted nuclease of predicted toxin-antitoxin system
MKFHDLRILTDENVSPKVTAFLRNQGIDVLDVKEQGWKGKIDDELLEIAYHDKRWVLTHDSDF